jgi:molybdopterin-guanine dinucleotide biosynthesis protein A
MGSDKGLIQYHNKPQREYLFDLLSKFCNRVYTSCRKGQELAASLNPIYDKFDFESPLNGIVSAFENHPQKAWLAVAVDMPEVDVNALDFLVGNRNDTKAATCFYDSEGKFPEPLLTIWEPAVYPLLRIFIQGGGISPREFLLAQDCKKVMYSNSLIHVNINTLADVAKFKSQ